MKNRRLWLASPWLIVILTAAAVAQTPPAIPDEVKTMEGDLTAEQQAVVDAFVTGMARTFASANSPTPAELVQAREAFTQAYTSGTGPGYRRYFAESVARNFAPVVLQANSDVARVNAAQALAAVSEPTMISVLLQTLQHERPTFRYWAAKALAGQRRTLVQVGGQALDDFFAAVRSQLATETNAPVMAVLFQLLDVSATDQAGLTGLDPVAIARAQAAARDVLLSVVPARLYGVRQGDAGAAWAFLAYVRTIESVAQWDQGNRMGALAALAMVLRNAGQAFQESFPPTSSGDLQRLLQLERLLRQTEGALVAITGIRQQPVQAAVAIPRTNQQQWATKGSQVLVAVLQWVGEPTTPGLLGAQPWNVPVPEVLPLQAPQTQTAPATPPTP